MVRYLCVITSSPSLLGAAYRGGVGELLEYIVVVTVALEAFEGGHVQLGPDIRGPSHGTIHSTQMANTIHTKLTDSNYLRGEEDDGGKV